jgi:FkbM family methyltransferase
MAQLVGPSGHVHAFEVAPSNYSTLLHNIQLNHLTNITAVNLGVSENRSQFKLVENTGDTSSIHLECAPGETSTISLDEYVAENKVEQLDFIKADVEGFEVRLLRGAENTISRFHPAMLIEVNPGALRRCGTSAEELVSWLTGHGYVLTRPTWHGNVPFSIKEVGVFTNIVASPLRTSSVRVPA